MKDDGMPYAEDWHGEPRVRDIALGRALGYSKPRKTIHRMVEIYAKILADMGDVPSRDVPAGRHGKQVAREYLFNEGQMNFLIMRGRTPEARARQDLMLRVWAAYQKGKLRAPGQGKAA